MKVKAKRNLQQDEIKVFIEGVSYDATIDDNGDIHVINEMNQLHYIADGYMGGLNDKWFVEHFEVVTL